jgi:VanZ family protein
VVRQELIEGLATGFGLDLPDPDAFGHALVFGLLALLVRVGRPRDPLLLHLSCWLLLAAVTEVLQLFTPDRDPEAGDWLMDALGTTAGLLLAELGLWLQRRLESARRRRQAAADAERQAKL